MSEIDVRAIISAGDETETDWYPDIDDEDYHTDKTTVGSTSLRKILKPHGSLRSFYKHFFEGVKNEESESLRVGKLVHKAVLEGPAFLKSYVVMPEFTGKTKDGRDSSQSAEAKSAKKKWLASLEPGTIVTTQYEIDMITGIVDSILSHEDGKHLFKNGKAEIAGMFVDEETKIRCKIKPDFLSFDNSVLVDLKTARSSERFAFGAQAARLRYDFQVYMYAYGVKMISGKFPEVIALTAVEKVPPYECGVYYLETHHLLRAETDFRNALRDLRKAIDTNNWPQRQEKLGPLYFPDWFVNEAVREEEQDAERFDAGSDFGFDTTGT